MAPHTDVLIFNPPRYRNGLHHKFNNATLWLASYLAQRGVGVRVVPLTDEHFETTVRAEIEQHRPRVAAISCKWWDTLYSATHIASLVKDADSRTTTVAGGQTASFFARDLVAKTDFDAVIRGDGEEPLRRLATGEEPVNCVFDDDRPLPAQRTQYVQSAKTLEDVVLVDDLAALVSDPSVINGYIWTGKGCVESCVYCSANARNNIEMFGRAAHVYRPIDLVNREIDILSQYPGGTRIVFDFDPVRGKFEADYYLKLFARIEKKKFTCYFCSWALPSPEIIRALSETFWFVELCIDVQTGSDRLRKPLGGKFLKPYFSDEQVHQTLAIVAQYDNITTDLSTLMGLPGETEADLTEMQRFLDSVYDRFVDIRYPYVSPMNVEPGSPLMQKPERFDIVLFQEDLEQFLAYTRRSFEENINCYLPESYDADAYHPLGVCPKEDYEAGNVLRVYERWREVQAYIDRRSAERALSRVRKYRRFGLSKVGILGGIDHAATARSHAE